MVGADSGDRPGAGAAEIDTSHGSPGGTDRTAAPDIASWIRPSVTKRSFAHQQYASPRTVRYRPLLATVSRSVRDPHSERSRPLAPAVSSVGDPAGLPDLTGDQARRLLDAVVGVASDLSLPDVLRRIVDSATRLAGARYGALGVLDEGGGELSEFIVSGLDARGAAPDRQPPDGQGRARSAHRAARAGAPARHPPAPELVRLPAQPPADAQLPGRAGAGGRRGVRQPVPGREGRRRRVHRGRRAGGRRAGRGGRRRGARRPACTATAGGASSGWRRRTRSPRRCWRSGARTRCSTGSRGRPGRSPTQSCRSWPCPPVTVRAG